MRRTFRHPLDRRSDLGRRVLEMPSRVHRPAEVGRKRGTRRALQPPPRSRLCLAGSSVAFEALRAPGCDGVTASRASRRWTRRGARACAHPAGAPFGRGASSPCTIRTASGLWLSTAWLTLPSRSDVAAPRPRAPMTIRSWRPSLALATISSAGRPTRTRVVTETSSGTGGRSRLAPAGVRRCLLARG